ncbi:MAG: Cytochrom asm protein, partial [Candidatus Hydrogenedentes bacterium]|nr:Cytochrom asm protein [Candidatus Hydrogenedentota bacterium]
MRAAILAILGCCVVAWAVPAAETPPVWDDETVQLFATLPLQEMGRVKPMDTFASFKLLQINGRRKCKVGDSSMPGVLGKMIYPNRKPVPWFLDCLFYPELARNYPMFVVENSDAIVALGAKPLGEKRGRYSYAQLEGARQRLFEMGDDYAHKPAQELDAVQRDILRLAQNVSAFEDLFSYMDFTRKTFDIGESQALAALFPGQSAVRLSEVLAKAPEVSARFSVLQQNADGLDEAAQKKELDAFHAFLAQLEPVWHSASAMALFPPADDTKEWLSVNDAVSVAFKGGPEAAGYIEWIATLERLGQKRDDRAAFKAELKSFHDAAVDRAKARGEYETIELEVAFYHAKLFYRSLVFFIICFVLIALSWLMPRNRFMGKLAPVALTVPTVLLIAGITMRCIIRGRPPVTTLYETVLFVTAVMVVVALFIEYINRQRVALALGAILGVLGMLLANKYEMANAEDTMPSMIAVLDTNFWLTAHVTTIVIGYAACLFSGAMAHLYVAGKLLGLRKNDPAFYSSLTRMVYGIFCFGFFFPFMGTVLGGIWANESWGRFWGWDP